MTFRILVGDCREQMRKLPERSVHVCITSFPYWGLRTYSGTKDGVQAVTWADGTTCPWGLESTFAEWIAHSLEVCREIWRVLRDDGTFWLQIGKSYAGQKSFKGGSGTDGVFARRRAGLDGVSDGEAPRDSSFKDGDLILQGPLLAEACRRDGWLLKMDNIFAKRNPKPESVTRRPASAHEYLFMLAKTEDYFYDDVAVRQPYAEKTKPQRGTDYRGEKTKDYAAEGAEDPSDVKRRIIAGMEKRGGRNLRSVWEEESLADMLEASCRGAASDLDLASRIAWFIDLLREREDRVVGEDSVWTVNNQPVPGAHTATFPEAIVEPAIKAGTSERGACPACGAPWERLVEVEHDAEGRTTNGPKSMRDPVETAGFEVRKVKKVRTTGWAPGCRCTSSFTGASLDPVPSIVLDPCGGSGTVAVVAERLKRDSILCEISPLYAAQARDRITDPDWASKQRKLRAAEKKAAREGGKTRVHGGD